MQVYKMIVAKNDPGQLSHFLLKKGFSRRAVNNCKNHGGMMLVNHHRRNGSYRLKEGDVVHFLMGQEPVNPWLKVSRRPLDIVEETADYLVINKPAGLLSIPSGFHAEDAVINRVLAYFEKQGVNPAYVKPHIVTRLDQDTSGLVLLGKNAIAHDRFSKLGKDAYAMTITLLLNSEGKKMGKTQKGAVWLDPNKTTPFEFYQYWRNVSDADVLKCLRMLTFLPLEQIDEMDKWEGSQLNQAKEILAYELTNLVHGEEEAKKAQESARALFTGGNAAEMPTSELTEADFTDGKIDILGVLVKSGLSASRSEARRAVEQGGVVVADEKVTDVKTAYDPEQFDGEGLVVRRGKKNFKRVVMSK